MLLRFIIIASATALTAEMLYRPEEQQQHIEKKKHYPIQRMNESIYNIQTPTGSQASFSGKAMLVTQIGFEEYK